MLQTDSQLALLKLTGSANINPLSFITGLKYNANMVKVFNNLTFLYDPNWEYAEGYPTYPIAFFHVKKVTELMNTEISQKPMLFYNAKASSDDTVKAGLLQIVADNIVIKPKEYRLDVLVPMNMDTFFNNSLYSLNNLGVTSFFMAGDTDTSRAFIEPFALLSSGGAVGILETLLTTLYGTEMSASSLLTLLCEQRTYNKDSIESMWRNRRIIKLKKWNSWEFHYLAIQNVELSKEGNLDGYYEGSISCVEVPILTLRDNAESSAETLGKISQKLSSAIGATIKAKADTFVTTMEASGAN